MLTKHCNTLRNTFLLAFLTWMAHFAVTHGAFVANPQALLSVNDPNSSLVEYYQPHGKESPEELQVLQLPVEFPNIMTKSKKPASSNANLTAITWMHAVNSQAELNEALASDIEMIEADISMGKVNSSGLDMPVMAHPPADSSDLSLVAFLEQILAYNEAHPQTQKGVKLDFKSIEVFEGSLNTLNEMIPKMSYPVWLNADIISGPVNASSSRPVDPERFFAGCEKYERAVLSIGWTTRWGANYTDGVYTEQQIFDMVEAIKSNNISTTQQPITFPVRAGIAANSLDQLHELVRSVNETNESSLTIWSSANDHVDVEKLRELIFSFGFERVYLDVPIELSSKLDLGRGNGAKAGTLMSLLNFSMISGCMLLASLWLQRF